MLLDQAIEAWRISKMDSDMATELLEAFLALTTRPPPDAFIQILPLPGETLLDESLLLLAVGAEVLHQRPRLFWRAFLHLADLLLQVHSAGTAAFPKQTLLDVIADQQSLDLVLVELAAAGKGVLLLRGGGVFGLFCETAGVEGYGFLNGWGCTT
jgi:hypothetical protein